MTVLLSLPRADVHAQVDSVGREDSLRRAANRLLAIPVVFYLPETRWGFGATGIYNFRFKGEEISSRSSQVAPGFAYTLEKQLLLYMPFTLYRKDEREYSFGEVGYYKYFYLFHGIGNSPTDDHEELFTVEFPRIQLNYLRQVNTSAYQRLYVGPQYWFENYAVKEREVGGQLIGDSIVGSSGGINSGLGLAWVYDSRDVQFYPTSGWFVQGMINQNHESLGSDFQYLRFRVNAARYFTLPWEHWLATNVYVDLLEGDVPFHQLALLGGPRRLRGYYEGRYRDNKAGVIQAEYRLPLFWRFKGALFGGVGAVSDSFDNLVNDLNLRYTYGAGLRFLLNQEESVHVRIDAGFGPGTSGFYITVGEAF